MTIIAKQEIYHDKECATISQQKVAKPKSQVKEMQLNIKAIKEFCKNRTEALLKEQHLNEQEALLPPRKDYMSHKQRKKAH